MRVSGIRIDGFKSFVDTVTVPIGRGMTGIVGPNGCGKSNLLEALRWCMGENSARRIRAPEMDDVIFSGTDRRQPRNVCEVGILLDNTAHDAPAEFNDADVIETVRRIERGEGSSYRINGKSARAKDVQLVFRDIGTGSGSAAMISQGRVAAVISARPSERRSVLEEAAGVSGLAPRRHDAELRLQATEQNLVRAEDAAGVLADQIERLKKEARQALRWREVDDQIRKVEALLLLAKLAAADGRLAEAGRAHDECERKLGEAVSSAEIAARARDVVAGALVPLREKRITHETQVARLDAKREQAQAEADRAAKDLDDANRRLGEAQADLDREMALVEEAKIKIGEIAAERLRIAEMQAGEGAVIQETADLAEALQVKVDKLDHEATSLVARSASAEAARAEAARRVNECGARARSASGRLAEMRSRLSSLKGHDDAKDLMLIEAESNSATQGAESARADLVLAEAKANAARDDEALAKASLAEASGVVAAVEAELRGLDALLDDASVSTIMSVIEIAEGYDAALAAALGRDIEASVDLDSARWWTGACMGVPNLPDDPEIVRLDAAVRGVGELVPKLSAVGVVPTLKKALTFVGKLEPGACIVSLDGAMVRWDGFVSETPSGGIVERLAAETRRRELNVWLTDNADERENLRVTAETTARDAAMAKAHEVDCRKKASESQDEARTLRERRDAAARSATETEARLTGLAEQVSHLEQEEIQAKADAAAAELALASAPDAHETRRLLETTRTELAAARLEAEKARGGLDGLQRAQRDRRERLVHIVREEVDFGRRLAGADERQNAIKGRVSLAGADAERLMSAPEAAAQAAAQALHEIDEGRRALGVATRELEGMERQALDAEIKQRETDQLVAGLREDRSRLAGAIAAAQEARAEVDRQIFERGGEGAKDGLAAASGVEPGTPVPAPEECELRHNKLLRERETFGNVNLLAEEQLQKATDDGGKMAAEREELRKAVDKLREQIAEIDREAQVRIEAAFIKVDEKFRQLFTQLFGGGHAQLKLVGGDTPLSSGIEIYASPPGKKMQSLSLLSGGEQALTALSLVFAAFLVNPSPICVLDEVDAPLDDANVDRLCTLMEDLGKEDATRFVVVTHHPMTMSRMDRLYGVTMAERGVSRIASVDLALATEIAGQDNEEDASAA